ncbi:MAG TPA: ATP synthase F1 subunit gamma [Acidimicrobiales bacterium]|nr:ATP synthase F1 subunit gamma [Acidimicrobiales bacterium]
MPGGQERALRRRIRSIQSTKKITRAMELIAASQIVRSLTRMTANRPYREGMARIVVEVAKGDPAAAEKLLGEPKERHAVAVLSIVADRGLAGPYNASTLRATERLVADLSSQGVAVRLFTVGKKAPAYFRFRRQDVERSFQGMSQRPSWADARSVALAVSTPFLAGEVEQVLLVSTRYKSAGVQAVEIRQLLPLPDPNAGGGGGTPAARTEIVADIAAARSGEGVATGQGSGAATAGQPASSGYTEFEPDAETLLAGLAPRAVESEIFTAMLEGAASFFTAQQRAMAAASENADELIRTLTRVMNRARQDAITTEIMEIVGGAEALRQSKGA